MYNGKIEIRKIDVRSNQVIETIEKTNSITLKALYTLLNGLGRGADAGSTSQSVSWNNITAVSSRFLIGSRATTGSEGFNFIGIVNIPELLDINEATPSIFFESSSFTSVPIISGENQPRAEVKENPSRYELTFKGRLNPPSAGQTRTFNLVYLTNASGNSANGNRGYAGFATVLSTPCVQQDNEILEFFYRVDSRKNTMDGEDFFWSQYFSHRLWDNAYTDFNNGTRIGPPPPNTGNEYQLGNNTSGGIIDRPVFGVNALTNKRKVIRNNRRPTTNKATNTPVRVYADRTNLSQLTGVKDYSFGIDSAIGQIWNSIHYFGAFHEFSNFVGNDSRRMLYTFSHKFTPENMNPVQNVFHKSADNNRPYLQPSFVSTGNGRINIDANDFTTKAPYFYRFNITKSGDSGVAEYNFFRRINFGFSNAFYDEEKFTSKPLMNIPMLNFSYSLPDSIFDWGSMHNRFEGILPDTNDLLHYLENGSSDRTPIFGFPNMQRHNDHTVIMADPYGLSFIDVYADDYFNIDENTVPQLQTQDLNAFCTDPSGNVWIATLDTGLYKLSSDYQTLTKITFTDPNININKCFDVDFKNNGDIWAFFEGGLAKSTDGGNVWEVFNEFSSTVFQFPGITDSNWANVQGIVVDKDSPDDRMALVLYAGNIIWWSRATATAMDSLVSAERDSSIVHRGKINQTTRAFPIGKRIKHFPNSDIFISVSDAVEETLTTTATRNSRQQFRTFRFGNTGLLSSIDRRAFFTLQEVIFAPNLQSQLGVLTVDSSGSSVLSSVLFSSSNPEDLSLGEVISTLPDAQEFSDPSQNSSYSMRIGTALCDMGKGIFIYTEWRGDAVRIRRMVASSSPDGGELSDFLWDKFGWNDIDGVWEKNNLNSKIIHSSSQPLIDGVSVSFTNGSGPVGSAFVQNEYIEAFIFDGIHKDNATTVSFSTPFHFRHSEILEDLSSPLVPETPLGLVQDKELNFNTYTNINDNISTFFYQINGMASYINQTSSQQGNVVSEIIFEGDFSVSFKTHPNGWFDNNAQYAVFGILPVSQISLFNVGTYLHYHWWFRQRVARAQNGSSIGLTSHLGDISPLDKDTVYSIERVSDTINYKINGSIVHSEFNVTTEPMVAAISFDREIARTFHEMKIDYYTENNHVVFMGDPNASTGVYDNNFSTVESWLEPTTTEITIDGVSAIVSRDTTLQPLPGEVVQRGKSGMLIFNSADANNPITAKYQVLYKIQ